MKYMTKPVTMDAIQWTGKNKRAVEKFVGKRLELHHLVISNIRPLLCIDTPMGTAFVHVTDYITKDKNGELWPIEAERFEELYEAAK